MLFWYNYFMIKNNSNKLYKSVFFKDEKLPFIEARFVLDSQYHYNEHFHDTLSIGAIEYGQAAFTHKNEEHILRPNMLAVINPNIVHSCNPIENEARTYHMIYIDSVWCKGLQETIFGKLDSFIEIPNVDINDKELFDEFIALNYLLLDSKVFYMEKEEVLQHFLNKLFKTYCSKKSIDVKKKSTMDTLIIKAQAYIKENSYKNITIKEISEYLEISEFYFIKLFKQSTHLTPHAFLLNQKVEVAKELLSQNKDISQIAYELGFSDQSHLNRVFKHYVAATPYEYKHSMN